VRDLILKEIVRIKDTKMAAFTRMVIDATSPNFYEVPASTSGKYHPAQSLGKGGLVRHIVASCYFGRELCMSFSCADIDEDIVQAAIILHDIGKVMGEPHDKVAFDWLNEFIVSKEIPDFYGRAQILSGVRWHMGPWSYGACQSRELKISTTIFPEHFGRTDQIVHLADYVSSRREVSVGFLPSSEVQ
jgi:hypothetical protein